MVSSVDVAPPNSFRTAAFSADSRLLATYSTMPVAISLWNARTGERSATVIKEPDIASLVFSPDGKTLATGFLSEREGDDPHCGTIALWDVASGQNLGRTTPDPDRKGNDLEVAFSPDGKRFATAGGSDQTARIWDAKTARALTPPMQHTHLVNQVRFSPDGDQIATGCSDGAVRLWDAVTGRQIGSPMHHGGPILSIEFAPDGRRLLTSSGQQFIPRNRTVEQPGRQEYVWVWELGAGRLHCPPLRGDLLGVGLLQRPGSNAPARAEVWDLRSDPPTSRVLERGRNIRSVRFNPSGTTILTSGESDYSARLWDVQTGLPRAKPQHHGRTVVASAFTRDGKIALTASWDRTVRLWDVGSGRPFGAPFYHPRAINDLCLSPDELLLLTAADDHARLWRLPEPLAGDPESVKRWAEAKTGMKLDTGGGVQFLTAEELTPR